MDILFREYLIAFNESMLGMRMCWGLNIALGRTTAPRFAGAGANKNLRVNGPAGVGVKICSRSDGPAGAGGNNFIPGTSLARVGAKKIHAGQGSEAAATTEAGAMGLLK